MIENILDAKINLNISKFKKQRIATESLLSLKKRSLNKINLLIPLCSLN